MKTNKTKTGYVDGFVFLVSKKNIPAYKKMAKEAEVVWKKFGAIDYKECMGNDLKVKKMKGMPSQRSFTDITKMQSNETVWFSYITYKNKAHRDQVNKKVMAYFDEKYKDQKDMSSMPFDVTKMSYGGFTVQVG